MGPTPATAYAIVDGLFQPALPAMRSHPEEALDRIEGSIRELLPSLLLPA